MTRLGAGSERLRMRRRRDWSEVRPWIEVIPDWRAIRWQLMYTIRMPQSRKTCTQNYVCKYVYIYMYICTSVIKYMRKYVYMNIPILYRRKGTCTRWFFICEVELISLADFLLCYKWRGSINRTRTFSRQTFRRLDILPADIFPTGYFAESALQTFRRQTVPKQAFRCHT